MIIVPVVLGIVGFICVLFVKQPQALYAGVFTTVTLGIFVPSLSPSPDITITAVAASILVLIVAILRSLPQVSSTRAPIFLILFLLWFTLVGSTNNASSGRLSLTLAEGTLYLLLALAASAMPRDRSVLLVLLPITIVIEFVISAGEQFLGTPALWPRVDGTDDISRRYNALAPWLIGRSMGTTSYGIPLGIMAGLALICCLWLFITRKRPLFLFLALLAGLTMLFSGTRTAFLAVGVCAIAYLIGSISAKRLAWYVPLLLSIFGVLLLLNPLELLGLGDIGGTTSYQHRFGVFESIPRLLGRPLGDLLVGTGYQSISDLLLSGEITGANGVTVLDQEFTRELAGAGLIGLILLLLAIYSGLRRGDFLSRLLLLFCVVFFLSFDFLTWRMLFIFFVMVTTGPADRVVRAGDEVDLSKQNYVDHQRPPTTPRHPPVRTAA